MTAYNFRISLCVVVLLLSQAACRESINEIKSQIDAANFCSTSADCADLGSHCPFGCHILVNQQHAARIEQLVGDFERSGGEQCLFDCVAISGIKCEAQKCVAVIATP